MAAYLPAGMAVPGDGAPALPQVAVQIVVRPAMGAAMGASKVRPLGGTMTRSMQAMSTRTSRSVQVLLARFPGDTDVSAAAGGVLDAGDGAGPRVVLCKASDRLYLPGSEVGSAEETAELTVQGVTTDGTCWLAECSV